MEAFPKIAITAALSALIAGVFAGCGSGDVPDSETESAAALSAARVSLATATPAQLAAASIPCPANSTDRKTCVVICHSPPGNPLNSKSLMIPIEAVAAHLDHGRGSSTSIGRTPSKSQRGDSLGACPAVPTPTPTPTPVPDGSSGSDGGNGGAIPPSDPPFCDPVDARDLDCDGLDDNTDVPVF